jgi:hypothetical protein
MWWAAKKPFARDQNPEAVSFLSSPRISEYASRE